LAFNVAFHSSRDQIVNVPLALPVATLNHCK